MHFYFPRFGDVLINWQFTLLFLSKLIMFFKYFRQNKTSDVYKYKFVYHGTRFFKNIYFVLIEVMTESLLSWKWTAF